MWALIVVIVLLEEWRHQYNECMGALRALHLELRRLAFAVWEKLLLSARRSEA